MSSNPHTTNEKNPVEPYLADFSTFEKAHQENTPSWLRPRRKVAISRFAEWGFPTILDEGWRFTNIGTLARSHFVVAPPAGEQGSEAIAALLARAESYVPGDATAARLVFVNGRHVPELSTVPAQGRGVKIGSLAGALASQEGILECYLSRFADADDRNYTFAALNTAFLEDGALVVVPQGVELDKPIHLVFLSVSATDGYTSAVHPRVLAVVGRNARASFVESHLSTRHEAAHWTNGVTELIAWQNASVDYHRLQLEDPDALHTSLLRFHLEADAQLSSHVMTLGGALVRNDVHAVLNGKGAHGDFNGLYVATENHHIDNHLRIEHVRSHGMSRQNYKGILTDRGRGVFTGRIVVHKDAQKTDAKQTNRNLLLSEEARANSQPQLEISADDVKCTHGTTVGQLDAESLFYLRARGLPLEKARGLLVQAFAQESIEHIGIASIREAMLSEIFGRLLARPALVSVP